MDSTIRAQTQAPLAVYPGHHTVVHGSMFDYRPAVPIKHFFFDSPGMESDVGFDEAWLYFRQVFAHIEKIRSRDASLILVARDGKGHPFQKSIVSAFAAQAAGWKVFRQYTWLASDGDFHRSRYAAQGVWALRQGNVPVNDASVLRYTDVIRAKDLYTSTGMVQALPQDLILDTLSLFTHKGEEVCDPFAGSGSLMTAAVKLGLRSTSIEIHPERAEALKHAAAMHNSTLDFQAQMG